VVGNVEDGAQPRIAIERHPVGDDLADGEQQFIALGFLPGLERAAGRDLIGRRQHQGDARRDRRRCVGLGVGLVAIVEGNVATPRLLPRLYGTVSENWWV
jgi:hypothetical protein